MPSLQTPRVHESQAPRLQTPRMDEGDSELKAVRALHVETPLLYSDPLSAALGKDVSARCTVATARHSEE